MAHYDGPERRNTGCPSPGCREPEVAAEKAVERVFAILGVDIHNPEQVTKLQNAINFAGTVNNIVGKSILGFFTALAAIFAAYIAIKFGWKQ